MTTGYDFQRLLAAFSLALALSACGGGGGGGGDAGPPEAQANMTPASLEMTHHHQDLQGNQVPYSVTALFATVPQGFPVVQADVPSRFNGVYIQSGGGGTMQVIAYPNRLTPPGTYTGRIRVSFYKDQNTVSATTSFPYTLVVLDKLTVTVKVDGVPTATFSSSNTGVSQIGGGVVTWIYTMPPPTITVRAGQVIELEASGPVSWATPATLGPSIGWTQPQVTSTTLRDVAPVVNMATTGFYVAMPGGGDYGAGMTFEVLP